MPTIRLPSFNDFSPEILKKDIRPCLQAIQDGGGDDAKVVRTWAVRYFAGVENKRSATNIPATLRSTGLTTGSRPMTLSDAGLRVLAAPNAKEASRRFCVHLMHDRNGKVLLEAMSALQQRKEPVTKKSLKAELEARGVSGLSTNTTDHTTLKNWMIDAGFVSNDGEPNDPEIKNILGISIKEAYSLKGLTLGQQVFLQLLRRAHETNKGGPFLARDLLRECLDRYPNLFDEAQFAKAIREPLRNAGWLEAEGLAPGPQGGKSGRVRGTARLLAVPISEIVPDFDQVVPAELRTKIDTPLEDISRDLYGTDKHRAGLALELLALRMIMDLGLDPRHFRLRSAESAFAEVDLIAEGTHLLFSRWTFQCKRYDRASKAKVGLGDVAKEVGIAVFARAHVIVMVTTSRFSKDALSYAREVTRATPLQFVFIDGSQINSYLTRGKNSLLDHFHSNAREVMITKRRQPLPTGE